MYRTTSDYINNHSEIITLSCVNKQWFQCIRSYLILIFNFKNYKLLKTLIKDHPFSLIKPENVPIRKYKSLREYKMTSSSKDHYTKILVHVYEDETEELLFNSNDTFPNNIKFNLELSMDVSQIQTIKENKLNEINKRIRIKKLLLYGNCGKDLTGKILEKVLLLNPGQIVYQPFDNEHISIDISSFFESPTLRLIEFDVVDPYAIAKINNNSTSLKSLLVSINLNDYVRIFNGRAPINTVNILNSVEQDWSSMVQTLSNNKTIRRLSLFPNNLQGNDIDFTSDEKNGEHALNLSYVTSGIKTILTSTSLAIETLEISYFDGYIQNNIFLEGLIRNKTIKVLSLFSTSISPIISEVLPHNKTIKNITFRCDNNAYGTILETLELLNSNSNVDLFSLTFYITRQKVGFNAIYDYLSNKFLHHSIKEFNFYLTRKIIIDKDISNVFLINNSETIVNLFKEDNIF
ncbi:hypothetical protein DICPUDRAFT_81941 [Dictyostelium purpureum]|uniref:FBD domain-containing protein n=1 Tax=Dictyostelium purpureum TaxID=5786 RepID=F0ZV19_DICPU|nr:uncharacterized protein DICPUDRAFT_81941 [Dictyostelium purpureum]EGC32218.1 hypothetical protein DICPUDRAFT_81941 [Dictyostelium purpureum]|eukprot:XP_003291254.1 hypothetical protein DICPUDRAFT_81941 [Dictyostelium purpureum]